MLITVSKQSFISQHSTIFNVSLNILIVYHSIKPDVCLELAVVAKNPPYGQFLNWPPAVTIMFSLLYVTCRDY